MDVRPGYKQTEVGVVPEDWEVRRFSEHFNIYAGGDVPKHSLSSTKSPAHPYPIFANAISNQGLYGYTAERRSNGDAVTITARGYLGHAEYRDAPFFPIVRLLVLEPCGELDSRYTAYAINELVEIPIESTGVPQLTSPQIGRYSIAAPSSMSEQRAISSALNDVDTLLAELDRIISKKYDMRQAAMQLLIAGRNRLPDFCGEWEEKRLGDVVRIEKGQLITLNTLKEGTVPVVAGGKKPAYFHAIANRFGPTITISASGASAGYVAFYDGSIFASDCSTIGESNHYCLKFIYYLLASRQKDIYGAQSGGAQPHVHAKDLNPMVFGFPPLDEQEAIAVVLSDMDAELVALQDRREKTKALKSAMMQELLTGKTRLT